VGSGVVRCRVYDERGGVGSWWGGGEVVREAKRLGWAFAGVREGSGWILVRGVISRARAVRLGFLDFYSPFLILVRALAVVYLTFTYMQLSTTSERGEMVLSKAVETKHGRPLIAVATCSKSGSEKHDTLNFGIFHVKATRHVHSIY
jgi:hypothetical protein